MFVILFLAAVGMSCYGWPLVIFAEDRTEEGLLWIILSFLIDIFLYISVIQEKINKYVGMAK